MLFEKISIINVTSPKQLVPHYDTHKRYITDFDKISCSQIIYLKKVNEICEFVSMTYTCNEFHCLFNYANIVFCKAQHFFVLKEILWFFIFISLLVLILLLSTIICTRYTPNVLTVIEKTRLSEYNSGAIILSILNGLPTLMVHICNYVIPSKELNIVLIVNEVYGATIYLTIFQTGILILIAPSIINSRCALRDLIFFLIFFFVYWISTKNFKNPNYWTLFFIFMFCSYVGIVLVDELLTIRKFRNRAEQMDDKSAQLNTFPHASKSKVSNITKSKPHITKTRKILIEFRDYLHSKKTLYNGEKSNIFLRQHLLPFRIIIALFIPIADKNLALNGWCKLGNIITLITLPALMHTIWNVYFCATIQFLGLIMAIIVIFTSEISKPPKYNMFFAFYGVFGSIFIVYLITCEIFGLFLLFANISGLSRTISGLTIITFAGTLTNVLTNTLLMKKGYKNMAFGSYFASGIHYIALILGSVVTIKCFMGSCSSLILNGYGETSIVFLLNFTVMALFSMSLSGFNLRRSTGIYFILLYLFYILFILLNERETIHPYETRHALYDDEMARKVDWAK